MVICKTQGIGGVRRGGGKLEEEEEEKRSKKSRRGGRGRKGGGEEKLGNLDMTSDPKTKINDVVTRAARDQPVLSPRHDTQNAFMPPGKR
ncbi:hypothetical protein Pmani_017453 [Petrolisthes manimaculis]|uniref:Uncharacterized protein n=1 Tax=Petrolisthes manimaculis TaxID=1843537 RepID=A0AAE1PMA2_9EUCA|nr:hypothetical protein Pmani_017453 [Petrolisthes manimaculis]